MKPMFLPDVETNPQASPPAELIRIAQANGAEYPKIWHLFAYLPQATAHLGEFTQAIMQGDCSLSPGVRELIAAYTSHRNDCPF
jgi:hypothetical protein